MNTHDDPPTPNSAYLTAHYRARAENAELERDKWRKIAEDAERDADEAEAELEELKALPRPLTPDDITDEMHSRAVIEARKHKGTKDALHSEIQMILKAALTEPPTRPEGAEELEAVLNDYEVDEQRIGDLADFLADRFTITPKEQS